MNANLPLTLLEQFLLLAFDTQKGELYPMDPSVLSRVIGGSVLMELTLRNRVDSDLRDMFTIDPTPTGDEILDPVLRSLSLSPVLSPQPIAFWLDQLADQAEALCAQALNRLEKRGLMQRPSAGLFWMFGAPKRAATVDEQSVRNLKAHLLGIVFGSDVPTPHDVMLTGLAKSCGLFNFLISETERQDAETRIAMVAKMDLISQAISREKTERQSARAVASGN